ncbi:response regulator transcription factor [Ohessyouella blattaphilus]|uniref:Stage 0 sporulation protein A homolog n=1 Tax=Ohessyouella blattaphilus TaxID=2949333 RepID=A0ABT1EFN4_9FIRM|nr:response regulator [Ohessyouella blattaphilus]MCP1109508.1 response regulator [Ohessyouella blattaphilus]MCR8562902.1 response regulator [Ohessyouella blattaphilus]MDL2250105.1 response regulator [Lachnospiraceae bacterium OttesenSCG-928-J05]
MLNVMIVDNEASIRKGLIHCIRWTSLDCEIVAQAEDGLDALEQIKTIKPDIIISDIRMPGMDGLELAETIHTNYPWIKMIILTGFPDFEYAKRAISYRVVDFVLKPTTVENLTRAIEKAKSHINEERLGRALKMELADKEEENQVLQRDLFLRDLLQGIERSHLHVINRMARLGLNLTGYYLLRLDIAPLFEDEDTISEWDEESMSMHLQQAQTILKECLTECTTYFLPYGNQTCYVVAEAHSSYPLTKQCLEAVSILNSMPQFILSIGISSYCDSPLLMNKVAEQAKQAAQFARYSPETPVISIEQLPAIPQHVMERVYSDLRHLKSAIENPNQERSQEILVSLFSYIRENKLPMDTVHTICLYIHQFSIGLLFTPGADGIMAKDRVSALKDIIENTSLDSLEENTFSFIEQILNQTVQTDAEAGQVVHAIKSYIAHNYSGDLSLDTLAGSVYLSPSYLSRLFKRETGENLSSYVQNLRVEEAKILLRTTTLKTYEVAERVGIPDPVYFSRIFKKITGTKPKDYRQN